MGWVLIHDNKWGALAEIKRGLFQLTQLILGANSLIVSAIPAVLTPEASGCAAAVDVVARHRSVIKSDYWHVNH